MQEIRAQLPRTRPYRLRATSTLALVTDVRRAQPVVFVAGDILTGIARRPPLVRTFTVSYGGHEVAWARPMVHLCCRRMGPRDGRPVGLKFKEVESILQGEGDCDLAESTKEMWIKWEVLAMHLAMRNCSRRDWRTRGLR